MLYPLSYEGGPGPDRAIQSLTRRHSPSLPTRSQQIVSSEGGEDLADAKVSVVPGIVGVPVQGGADLLVALQPAHDIDRDAVRDEPGRVGVP